MTPRSTSLLSIALAALFLGCGHTYAIWIGPDATVSTLAFGLASKPHGSHPEALNWFGVSTCQAVDSNLGFHERKRIWAVRGWDLPDSSRLIHSIAYGHVPPGFVESVPAQPLSPGCYVASVSASTYEEAEVYFWIDADRAVKLWTRAQFDSATVAYGRSMAEFQVNYDSVFAKCSKAYKAATTAMDTAQVEKAVWGDTVRFGAVTCGEIQGEYQHWTGKPI